MWNISVVMIIDAEARRRMVPVKVSPPRPRLRRASLVSYERLYRE